MNLPETNYKNSITYKIFVDDKVASLEEIYGIGVGRHDYLNLEVKIKTADIEISWLIKTEDEDYKNKDEIYDDLKQFLQDLTNNETCDLIKIDAKDNYVWTLSHYEKQNFCTLNYNMTAFDRYNQPISVGSISIEIPIDTMISIISDFQKAYDLYLAEIDRVQHQKIHF